MCRRRERCAWLAPGREDQATFQLRRLPTLGSDARELLLIDHVSPNHAARRRFRYADENRDAAFAVEQAAAAALAVRREAFVACGGFDERYVPAWYEDVDLCARLASAGTILYLPEARFRHRGGESASRLGYARFLPVFYRNALRYRRDRYGLAARLTYRVLLAKGMVLRLLLLPFRADVPRSRPEAARAYLAVLRLAFGLGGAHDVLTSPSSSSRRTTPRTFRSRSGRRSHSAASRARRSWSTTRRRTARAKCRRGSAARCACWPIARTSDSPPR